MVSTKRDEFSSTADKQVATIKILQAWLTINSSWGRRTAQFGTLSLLSVLQQLLKDVSPWVKILFKHSVTNSNQCLQHIFLQVPSNSHSHSDPPLCELLLRTATSEQLGWTLARVQRWVWPLPSPQWAPQWLWGSVALGLPTGEHVHCHMSK